MYIPLGKKIAAPQTTQNLCIEMRFISFQKISLTSWWLFSLIFTWQINNYCARNFKKFSWKVSSKTFTTYQCNSLKVEHNVPFLWDENVPKALNNTSGSKIFFLNLFHAPTPYVQAWIRLSFTVEHSILFLIRSFVKWN